MAHTDELAFPIKRFIVQRLACFDTPTIVAAAVKEDFGLEVSKQRVHYYDPTKKAGAALPDDLKALFTETRTAFLADLDAIPIANKAVRLRMMDRMAHAAEARGNMAMAAQLCEAAAKEMGGAFTNKFQHEHAGKDGGPIKAVTTTMTVKEAADAYASTLNDGG